jgi:hypothetical protein
MGHSDAWEGKWREKWRMEWVASALHTTSEHGVSSITTADAHTSAASSRLNWRPRRFKWTRPFRRKTKSGFWVCHHISNAVYSVIAGQCQPGDGACLSKVTLHALVLVYFKSTTLSFCAKHFAHPPSFLPFTQHSVRHKIILRHFRMSQNLHIYGPIKTRGVQLQHPQSRP